MPARQRGTMMVEKVSQRRGAEVARHLDLDVLDAAHRRIDGQHRERQGEMEQRHDHRAGTVEQRADRRVDDARCHQRGVEHALVAENGLPGIDLHQIAAEQGDQHDEQQHVGPARELEAGDEGVEEADDDGEQRRGGRQHHRVDRDRQVFDVDLAIVRERRRRRQFEEVDDPEADDEEVDERRDEGGEEDEPPTAASGHRADCGWSSWRADSSILPRDPSRRVAGPSPDQRRRLARRRVATFGLCGLEALVGLQPVAEGRVRCRRARSAGRRRSPPSCRSPRSSHRGRAPGSPDRARRSLRC